MDNVRVVAPRLRLHSQMHVQKCFYLQKQHPEPGKAAQTLLPSSAWVFLLVCFVFQEQCRCLLYLMALFLMLYRRYITREPELLITNIVKENGLSCGGWVYAASLLPPGKRRQTTACGL